MENWKKRSVDLIASLFLGAEGGGSVVPYYPQKYKISGEERRYFVRTSPERQGISSKRICAMLSELEGPEYLARVTVNNVKNVNNAKKAIKKAFQNQIEGKGFSLVEVLSTCPTNWGMTPQKALQWVDEKMIPYYPLGVYKDRSATKEESAK